MGTSPTPVTLDQAIADLTDQVAASVTVEGSAATLISGFATMVQDSINDPPALEALVAKMNASAAALSSAVSANTPAATPAAKTT